MESSGNYSFMNMDTQNEASRIGVELFDDGKCQIKENNEIQISETNIRKRCPFSKEEDELLLSLVQYFGIQYKNVWNVIASHMKNRNARQCRERYQLFLAADVKKGVKWTKEEDNLLLSKYPIFGTHWKNYEPFFNGRTSYNIKNRFKSLTTPKKIIKNIPNISKLNHLISSHLKKQNVAKTPKADGPKSLLKIDSTISFSTEKNEDDDLFFIDNNDTDPTLFDDLDQNDLFNDLYF